MAAWCNLRAAGDTTVVAATRKHPFRFPHRRSMLTMVTLFTIIAPSDAAMKELTHIDLPYPNGEGMEQALALMMLIGIAAMASVAMMYHGPAIAPDALPTDTQEYDQHEQRALLIANSEAANN